jgi:DNA-binding response OmpR family regulator
MSATKVLLVNDDEVVRVAVADVLEQSGFAVTCATNHLPQLFHDLVIRLSSSTLICGKELLSGHAVLHGIKRRKSGYTAAMLVEESRCCKSQYFIPCTTTGPILISASC